LDRLSKRLKELQAKKSSDDPEPILTFDKDDEDTLDFVTATANLRADSFHIGCTSKFDTKRMLNDIKSCQDNPN
jgi:ubiquitin-like 1-activating enzyme E1 B